MSPAPPASKIWRRTWSGRKTGRTAIVPGVSFVDPDEADVMRGEEVQLLGAFAAGMVPADSLVCHPGTHNKWARLDGRPDRRVSER